MVLNYLWEVRVRPLSYSEHRHTEHDDEFTRKVALMVLLLVGAKFAFSVASLSMKHSAPTA